MSPIGGGVSAAVQGVGTRQSFDDVVESVAGQDVVMGRADNVIKITQCITGSVTSETTAGTATQS